MVLTKGLLLFGGGILGLSILLVAGVVTLLVLRRRTKKLQQEIKSEYR